MRIKAFLLSLIFFLGILFGTLGSISAFMSNSQLDLLREKSIREYQSLTATLTRDMAILYQRSSNFHEALKGLIAGYNRYYSQNNILLTLTWEPDQATESSSFHLNFHDTEQGHYLYLVGGLPEPFQEFQLRYEVDITENIETLEGIQNQLLFIAIIASIVAVFVLYFLFAFIFKPLKLVAESSRKIANGNYEERIEIKGENELSEVALDFNQMALKVKEQIETLEAEAEAKQQFVDNFSHEIRTPLTAILGYAEFIQKTSVTENQMMDLMQYIIDESIHMQNLGNLLLELATLRHYTPIKKELSLSKVFEEVSQSMKKDLSEKNVQLICEANVDYFEGQEDLIKSLLINLVSNALKVCLPEVGKIMIKSNSIEGGIQLTILDNGCGISDSDISKIREPFYRIDKARNRKDGGAGLGLTLCDQIVKIHQGEMSFESELGIGTEIKITFLSS